MADCFSLPNAAGLVEQLRFLKKYMRHTEINELYSDEVMAHAADAIEALMQENAKLKEKLDAAVADIKMNWLCAACKKRVIAREWMRCENKNFYAAPCEAPTCLNFEWRGIQKEEENATD